MAAPASAALIIDDFNCDVSAGVEDALVNGIPVVGPRGSGGTFVNGNPTWSRDELFANLVVGNSVGTEDCASCAEGHFINDANSAGHGYWSWQGGDALDVNSFGSTVVFTYSTDVPGADLILSFTNGGVLVDSIWIPDLGDTNNILTTLSVPLPAGLSNIDDMRLDVFSAGGTYTDPTGLLGTRDFGMSATALDFNIDQVAVVPEPGSTLLLGARMTLLAMLRRRRHASSP